MPELSNLLRQRFAATENGAGAHPDPDVLTAYTEHCLPATERQAVVAHLSVCGPCREVVALSQPQIPELAAQAVVRPAPASVWRRLFTPALGIAGAVAAMAIIAVLVLQLPQKSVQQSALPRTAETQQAEATPAASQDQSPAIETGTLPERPAVPRSTSTANMDIAVPVPVKKAPVVELRAEATRNKIAAGSNAPAPPPSPERTLALTAAMQKKDYINTNFFAGNDADNVSGDDQRPAKLPVAPQPQPSSASGAFTVTNGKINAFAPSAVSRSNLRILTPNPPSVHFGLMLGKMATATAHTLHLHTPATNPALRASDLGYSALGGPGMFSNSLAKSQSTEVSAAPEKLESGSLAKSDALSAGAMGGASARSLDSASTLWKVAGGKLIKSAGPSQWEDAYPTSGFEFSVVNSHGNDVWAGGTHASIIHSRDGGLTWENVKLGDAATGTIVSILPEVLNVQVKTSDNQLWSSTDGGNTWTMQND
ncbi:MAG TPA: zf-HC2 domain-containing protein [Candidatus Angelobacter sp.]|jgi:hypothetical protein